MGGLGLQKGGNMATPLNNMPGSLRWAVILTVAAAVCMLTGFDRLAGFSEGVAKLLFVIFVVWTVIAALGSGQKT